MTGRLAAWARWRTVRALGLGVIAIGAAGVAGGGAQAGSSSHAKTTPGVEQAAAEPSSAAAGAGAEQEQAAEPAEKTAKAEPAPESAAGETAETPETSTVSPIGGAWETETLVRPEAADEEITDAEALEIIDKVNVYFNDLKKAKAQFVQFDGNNEKKSGDFYFKRPGKVRFDYDRPSRLKIISDGEYLTVENHDLRTSDRYPLDATPFKLLLSEKVDLLQDARILSIDKGEDVLILTLEDKTGESSGKIRLFFRTDPELQLASWIITDAQGVDTRVDIGELKRDVELSAELFQFSDIGLPDFRQ